jgi:hypothetical protein
VVVIVAPVLVRFEGLVVFVWTPAVYEFELVVVVQLVESAHAVSKCLVVELATIDFVLIDIPLLAPYTFRGWTQ